MHFRKILMGFIAILIVSFSLVASAGSLDISLTIIRGNYRCIGNPCFSDPCLPGMMWAIKSDDTFYYLIHEMYGAVWDCYEVSWDWYTPREGDAIVVVGEVLEYQDIWGKPYYTIEVERLLPGICPVEILYGEFAEETELLRCFRDNVLNQTPEGHELIRLYYELSPVIANAMEEDEEFKVHVKEMIDGMLPLIRKVVE